TYLRPLSFDLRRLHLVAKGQTGRRTTCRRMSDVRFPEARQNHPRKVAVGDHGVDGVAPKLVVSGTEGGIENERWQPDYPHAHVAQARPGLNHQGIPRPSPNDLRTN